MERLSLKARMVATIAGALTVTLGLMILLQVRQTTAFSKAEALRNAQESTHRYANEFAARLNEAIQGARTVAQTFEGMKLAWVDDRSLYNTILSQLARSDTNLVGAWSCWEPDALHSKDKDFSGKTGHDETGRFIPLWYRTTNDVQLEKLAGYATQGAGDYYQLLKTTGKEVITDPFSMTVGGTAHNVVSIASPVRYNGELVGAVGILIPVSELAGIVQKIRPYDTGFAGLLANSGTYVAHLDTALVGRNILEETEGKAIQEAVRSGKPFSHTTHSAKVKGGVHQVLVPIRIGESVTPWSLSVSLPMAQVLMEANRVMIRSVGTGAVALLAILAVVSWLAVSITRPLHGITATLNTAATSFGNTAGHINQSSQMLAEGASEQAASLEETTSSLEELASMTRRNAESATRANHLTREARAAADAGAADVQSMSKAMEEIRNSSNEISKIIRTIDEIAFQTNILALNAAVEAARAGEAGMGFAVVAEEVRNLAQRSAQAAKETAGKIENAISRTEQGVQVSSKVARGLNDILTKVREVDQIVAEVAAASQEQSLGIEQISSAVTDMDKVTQGNAAHAEEGASAAQELSSQAAELRDTVDDLRRLMTGSRRGDHATAGLTPETTINAGNEHTPSRIPSVATEPPATKGNTANNTSSPRPTSMAGSPQATPPNTLRHNSQQPAADSFKDF